MLCVTGANLSFAVDSAAVAHFLEPFVIERRNEAVAAQAGPQPPPMTNEQRVANMETCTVQIVSLSRQ